MDQSRMEVPRLTTASGLFQYIIATIVLTAVLAGIVLVLGLGPF